MTVIQSTELKNVTRNSGIKVTADLRKDRDHNGNRVKKDGIFVYYKNGRLHIKERCTGTRFQESTNLDTSRRNEAHGDDARNDYLDFPPLTSQSSDQNKSRETIPRLTSPTEGRQPPGISGPCRRWWKKRL